jgi:Methyltransferase domain
MYASKLVKTFFNKLPPIKELIAERDALVKANGIVPAGHFYSPVVSIDEVSKDASRVFRKATRVTPGIDMNEAEQLELLTAFEQYYPTMPFKQAKSQDARYYFDNPAFTFPDAIALHCMIRYLRPKKIVEVGSGFSSCATLDTNERFFKNAIETTFIEPYPKLLESLITAEDKARVAIIPNRLQDADLALFEQLQKDDILFIDSTHVSKAGSDVNCLFFDILPILNPGVYVHIHDVFYPFEYPQEWIFGGRSWNEIYVLRAFLQYNDKFKIVFMNSFMEKFHEARFRGRMPLFLKNPGGSIWLRRV